MEEQQEPPEIPEEDGETPPVEEDAPAQGGELLPSEEESGGPESLDFDDLPDPPGDVPLRSAFAPEPEDDGPPAMDAVLDVPVKVQAVLGRARMSIAELVSMHPGYIFELDRRVGEPIDILVNDRPIARGEIVMIDGSLGVTLTEIVKQDG